MKEVEFYMTDYTLNLDGGLEEATFETIIYGQKVSFTVSGSELGKDYDYYCEMANEMEREFAEEIEFEDRRTR